MHTFRRPAYNFHHVSHLIGFIPIPIQDMTRREQYGHIINISSMSGHRVPNAASGGAFYAATKHALRALTEGLRQEVRMLGPALGCQCDLVSL